ncbi:hypothetical protein FWC63_02840 [Candidatus Saccharibacteria bacterium]|nr:hypothetical protein [Candidatus Saccharibacteria bacterium]
MKDFLTKAKDFFRRHWGLWIVLAAALVISLPFMHPEAMTGHDAPFHMFRYQGIINAWRDGQLVPQLDPVAFGGFGYAPSLFYGPLTGWLVIFFSWIAGGYVGVGVNMLMILSVFGAALACYKLIREVTGKTTPAVLAAVAYAAAPYHLLDYFIRRADGEILPFIFAPLVFLGIWRIIQKSDKNAILPIVIGGAGMVLSHNLSALLFALLATIFILMNWRPLFANSNWKLSLPKFAISGVLMLMIASVFILPMLEARSATLYNIFNPVFAETNMGQNANAVWNRGIHPGSLFFDSGVSESMFFGLGITAILGVVAFFIVRKNLPDEVHRFTRHMLIFGLVTAFMTTVLFFPWQWAPGFMASIQFPWRLLLLSSFALPLVAGISLYWLGKNWFEKQTKDKKVPKWSFAAVGSVLMIAVVAPLLSVGMDSPRWGYWPDYRLSSFVENPNRHWWFGAEYEYLPARVMDCTDQRQCPLKYEMPDWLYTRKAQGIIRVCDEPVTMSALSDTAPDAAATCAGYLEFPLFFYPGWTARTNTSDTPTYLEVFESDSGLVAVRVEEGMGVDTSQYESPLAYGVFIDVADGIEVFYATTPATMRGFVLSATGLAGLAGYTALHGRRRYCVRKTGQRIC